MNHIDTMKLALEALEWNMGYLPSYGDGTRMAINAITALREALAEQPAQRKPWVGLTPEQRATIAEANNMLVDDDLFDAIEAELKEKNA